MEADVILAIGTAFGEADCSSWNPAFTFSFPPTLLILIDIDPQEIGKIYPVEVGIVGDAKATLKELIRQLRESKMAVNGVALSAVAERKSNWEKELIETQQDESKPIHPARLLKELIKALPEDAIVVTDVGWNKNGAGQQLLSVKPSTFITSGGMAVMGFSPGAAVGAKIGAPDQKVVCLVGDGGLLSALGALATVVELDVPVLFVLFNNFCYSTIRTVGVTYFKNDYGTEFTTPDGAPYNPDFPLLAKSFGIDSALVEEPSEIAGALATAMAATGSYLLEVRTRGDVPMPRTVQLAHALDPVSSIISRDLALLFHYRGEFDLALEQCDHTVELNPHFSPAYWALGLLQEQRGDFDESAAAFSRASELTPQAPRFMGALGRTLALSGKPKEAIKILTQLQELSGRRYVSPFEFASIYFALGDREKVSSG